MNRKTTILRPVILILVTAACAGSMISGGSGKSGVSRESGVSRQSPEPDPGDTLYYLRGVTISPITAAGRSSPVTFSELNQDEIVLRTSVRDLPVLLSELPSMTTYSENGNGIGYTYLNLRGFDQRRLSVTINGVPQNDPEDHNVYWIDFPDLAANLQGVHVQRGAGSSFYGPPAIGGSVNLVASPFRPDPGITLETMFGFQQFGGTKPRTILNTRKYSVAVNSGPVAERYLFYGRLSTIRSGGYRNNSWVEMNSWFCWSLQRAWLTRAKPLNASWNCSRCRSSSKNTRSQPRQASALSWLATTISRRRMCSEMQISQCIGLNLWARIA